MVEAGRDRLQRDTAGTTGAGPRNGPLMLAQCRLHSRPGTPARLTRRPDAPVPSRTGARSGDASPIRNLAWHPARFPDGGSVCLQTGGAAAANHNERLQGIRDTLGGMSGTTPPGNKLAGENGWTEINAWPLITDDDDNRSVQGLTDILAAQPDLTAFISTGAFTQWFDNAYGQAVEPYKARMDSGDLSIIVADTLPMQMEQLKDGLSNGQVGQRPFEMGYKAMFILKDLVEGKTVEDPIYTGLDVCTMDNADTCLAK